MLLEFCVPGKAVGKERPRVTIAPCGKAHAHTPTKTRRYEALVARCASIAMFEKQLEVNDNEPLAVEIVAYFARPKARQHQHERFPYHITRADEDNIQKAIKDALRGVIYKDDKQIVDSHTALRYCPPHDPAKRGMTPHVQVRVWTAGTRGYQA